METRQAADIYTELKRLRWQLEQLFRFPGQRMLQL